ncbi:MAG: TrmH family RNA methyltransferase [Pseudomonadota bacterium]
MLRLALYQPDIPQNVGAAIRAAACFGAGLDIIEPCGFPLNDREIRRVALDYGALAAPTAHSGWEAFQQANAEARIVLLTTKGAQPLWEFQFEAGDIILMGRESAGVPDEIHESASARLRIPMAQGARSLNVAVAAGVALAAARRCVAY